MDSKFMINDTVIVKTTSNSVQNCLGKITSINPDGTIEVCVTYPKIQSITTQEESLKFLSREWQSGMRVKFNSDLWIMNVILINLNNCYGTIESYDRKCDKVIVNIDRKHWDYSEYDPGQIKSIKLNQSELFEISSILTE